MSEPRTRTKYNYDQATYNGLTITNGIGRRTSMTDAAGSEAWSYDVMGRELTEQRTTNSVTKTTSYTFNFDGSLLTLTYPSGRIITYKYDSAERPSIAQDIANNVNYAMGTCGTSGTGVCYAPQGAIASAAFGQSGSNGFNLTDFYNRRLQPCRMFMSTATTVPSSCTDTSQTGNILDLNYSFVDANSNNNGNVMSVANNRDTTRSQAFTYDQVNRIWTAKTTSTSGPNCWGLNFGYDQWANLLSASVTQCSAPPLSLGVNTSNQITNPGFSYDLSGNERGDVTNSYTWDAESQIKAATGVNYTYDGDGNRVQKSNGKLYWYGSGTEILDESDLSGNITDEYVFFGGKRIAHRTVSNGNIYYYAEDFIGSSRVIIQAGQTNPCYDADFYPFGGERTITSNCPQNYKFQGKERDAETSNDDFGARYYSSSFGRWLSPDWSSAPAPVPYADLTNPQTLNLYAMVRDNPETFKDLDGHFGTLAQATVTFAALNDICPGTSIFCDQNQTTENQQPQPQYQQPQNEQEATLSNIVYNETSSLRPDPRSPAGDGGSAEALHDAQVGIAEVALRDLGSGHPERVAPSDLNDKDRRAISAGNTDAIRAHNDALAAARKALAGSNETKGDTQFRLRPPSISRDRPINRKDTNFAYGPFPNTLGPRQTVVFAP